MKFSSLSSQRHQDQFKNRVSFSNSFRFTVGGEGGLQSEFEEPQPNIKQNSKVTKKNKLLQIPYEWNFSFLPTDLVLYGRLLLKLWKRCALSVLTYEAETCGLINQGKYQNTTNNTKSNGKKLIGYRKRRKFKNEVIRGKTDTVDVASSAKKLK